MRWACGINLWTLYDINLLPPVVRRDAVLHMHDVQNSVACIFLTFFCNVSSKKRSVTGLHTGVLKLMPLRS